MRSKGMRIAIVVMMAIALAGTAAAQDKPNILVIWGDDVGVHNISAYNHGIMGYQTPNIDRIAKEGAMFTDSYAQQSCTAGRASFILGQHPFRTGLLTIGMPGLGPRHPRLGADHRRPAQGPGLHDRPVRQEPPRRPGQAPAHQSTASTSSSATSTTSTPRRSRRPTTTRRIRSSTRSSGRAA